MLVGLVVGVVAPPNFAPALPTTSVPPAARIVADEDPADETAAPSPIPAPSDTLTATTDADSRPRRRCHAD